MNCRLVVTGAGGYIGSYIVPMLEKAGWEIVRAKYKNGEFVFSSQLKENESIIVLNLAAATAGANRFSVGYELSILMIEKLSNYFNTFNISVIKFIQFSSFGELFCCRKKTNMVFHKLFKSSEDAVDNYQYWKIKQRSMISNYFTKVYYIVIPFVADSFHKEIIDNSFINQRKGRKILISRLVDIFVCVEKVITHQDEYEIYTSDSIYIPNFKRVALKGDYSFIKTVFNGLCSSIIHFDKKRLNRLFYKILSQKILGQ